MFGRKPVANLVPALLFALLPRIAQADDGAGGTQPTVTVQPSPTTPAATPPAAEVPSPGRDRAAAFHAGFRWGLSPGAYVASNGPVGFYMGARIGYGIDTGRLIVVPQVSLAAVFAKEAAASAIVGPRLVYPISFFAPFVEVGAGPGVVFGEPSSTTGAALGGGGGFTLHPTDTFAIGVQTAYMRITKTDVSVLSVGPILWVAL
jgi:hypothetical protein